MKMGDETDLTPYKHSFDPETDSVSEELVRAVATFNDSEPTDLAVLADVIDPDALDDLFQHYEDGQARNTEGYVAFEYNGHQIELETNGTIVIDSPESTSDD